jgi:hypothetical protein
MHDEVYEGLYRAFADQPLPDSIDGCPCCLDRDEISALLTVPLRQLSPKELGSYASSVFLTVGGERDFRYFLPRILEILASVPGWWPDPEVVGRAIGTVPWARFTADQQSALIAYFDGVLDSLLAETQPDGCAIDSWLCGSSHVVPGWDAMLEKVSSSPRALAALFEWHSADLRRGTLANGFWDDSKRKETFRAWILSDRIQLLLPPLVRL